MHPVIRVWFPADDIASVNMPLEPNGMLAGSRLPCKIQKWISDICQLWCLVLPFFLSFVRCRKYIPVVTYKWNGVGRQQQKKLQSHDIARNKGKKPLENQHIITSIWSHGYAGVSGLKEGKKVRVFPASNWHTFKPIFCSTLGQVTTISKFHENILTMLSYTSFWIAPSSCLTSFFLTARNFYIGKRSRLLGGASGVEVERSRHCLLLRNEKKKRFICYWTCCSPVWVRTWGKKAAETVKERERERSYWRFYQ
jgi:hypothetical protein